MEAPFNATRSAERGWKSQEPPLEGRERTHDPTPPRRGATHNSAVIWGFSRTRPSARGKRNCRGVFESRTPTPNAAAPRLLGQRLSLGLMGTHLAQRPKRRGAAGLVSFSLSFLRREFARAVGVGLPDRREPRRGRKRPREPRNPLSFRFHFAFNFPPPPCPAQKTAAHPIGDARRFGLIPPRPSPAGCAR